jgi:hypothetical protein
MISINPPPADKCCERCGKNIKDLKPYGKAGDPLVGDFNGAYLLKTFRSMAPQVTDKRYLEIEKRFEEAKDGYEGFEEAMIKEFGIEKAEQLMFQDQLANTISASWECRDCIVKE